MKYSLPVEFDHVNLNLHSVEQFGLIG